MARDNSGQEEKMQQILQATLEVISRETISGTRMHLIAKEAGMSQSILHYYFASKKDILVRLMQDLKREFNIKRTQDVDAKRHSLSQNLEGFLKQKKDIIAHQRKMDVAQFDFFVQSLVDEELKVVFRDFFQAWYDEIHEVICLADLPQANKDKLAKTVPRMLISLMMGASMQYLIWDGELFDLDEYFSQTEEMLLDYLNKVLA